MSGAGGLRAGERGWVDRLVKRKEREGGGCKFARGGSGGIRVFQGEPGWTLGGLEGGVPAGPSWPYSAGRASPLVFILF
jgi:hypothetical protein